MSRLGPGSGPIASSSQLCLRACIGRDGSERPCHLVVPGPFCRLCSQSPQPGTTVTQNFGCVVGTVPPL